MNLVLRIFGRIGDLLLLNLLFLLTSFPIITLGPSLAALYTVALRIQKGEEPVVTRTYFQAFSSNFKASTLLWLPILFGFLFFGTDLYIIHTQLDESLRILQFPVWFFLFAIASVFIYAFPLIAIYNNTWKQTIRNAFLLGLANFPLTFFVLVLAFVIVNIAQLSPTWTFIVISLFLFIGFGFLAWMLSFFFVRVFDKVEKANAE